VEEVGNGLLPPRIILHGLHILLLLDLLATHHTRAIEVAEAGNGLLSSGIILWGLSAYFDLDAHWDCTIVRRRFLFFLIATVSKESLKVTGRDSNPGTTLRQASEEQSSTKNKIILMSFLLLLLLVLLATYFIPVSDIPAPAAP
jgi:hypothetical protein